MGRPASVGLLFLFMIKYLIGITGPHDSGKSYVTQLLHKHLPDHPSIASYSHTITEYFFKRMHLEEYAVNEFDRKLIRPILDWLGHEYTELRVNPNMWNEELYNRLRLYEESHPGCGYIIDGLRYPRDVKAMRQETAHTLLIEVVAETLSGYTYSHPSGQGLISAQSDMTIFIDWHNDDKLLSALRALWPKDFPVILND